MRRARRPCPTPGCPNLTSDPKGCDACRSRSTHGLIYDGAWIALSRRTLKRHPRCQICHDARSVEVHHVQSVATAPRRRLDPTNILALCHDCHRQLTPHPDV